MVWSLLTISAGNHFAGFVRSVGRYKVHRTNLSEYGELIFIKSNNNCVEIASSVIIRDKNFCFPFTLESV